MRKIKWLSRFKKDFRREESGVLGKKVRALLEEAVTFLAEGKPLPFNYLDHPLNGKWNDHRDCHLRPDLILVYRNRSDDLVELVRLGSHSELGL